MTARSIERINNWILHTVIIKMFTKKQENKTVHNLYYYVTSMVTLINKINGLKVFNDEKSWLSQFTISGKGDQDFFGGDDDDDDDDDDAAEWDLRR